jgi:glucose-6-phosphate dehydrogenase assembly protein OpcA
LQKLAAWMAKHSDRIRVSDLNWARTTPWRELMAQCFDAPERRPYLKQIRSIHIEYEMESARFTAQRAQSLLLAAWLGNRLGWTFDRAESPDPSQPRVLYFQSPGGEVKIDRILRKVDGGGSGGCFSFVIEAGDARFSFTRGQDGRVVKTLAEVPGQPNIGRTVRIEVEDEVEILNGELMVSGRDHVYEQALAQVARLNS